MCECYRIGGPFVAEDPDCPEHGWEAQREAREQEEEQASLDQRLSRLERLVKVQSDQIQQIRPLAADAARSGSEFGRRILDIISN